MGHSVERTTVTHSASIHDKMCMYMSILFDRSESRYRPSEIGSQRLQACFNGHVTYSISGSIIDRFLGYWDVTPSDLEIAFSYAIQGHWSIEDILISHYLYYTPFSSISKDIDMLPKTVSYYCVIGTNRFMLSYSQLAHTRYQRMQSDQHSIALLEAIDPVIASLTL